MNIGSLIEANQWIWNLAMTIFWVGAIIISIYIKKVNDLTYPETFMAAAGLKKFKRNWKINVGQFLVMVVPMGLMAYVISSGGSI
jgi:hypothetical protein